MLRFKQFLLESPAPPDIKELQDFVYKKEAAGNEDTVLGLHGGVGDPTIGFGHSLQDLKKSKEKFARVLPEVDFDAVSSGKAKITREQAQKLFDDDTQENIDKVRQLVPDLDDYTPEAQKGLYSSTFRGTLGGSPIALSLLRAGKYDEAADELLNNNEYLASKKGIPIKGQLRPGIATRMEQESALIRGEAERRKNRQTTTPSSTPTVKPSTATTSTSTEKPAATATPAVPQTTKPPTTNKDVLDDYTIQSGDTLWKLTKGDQKKIDKIVAANPNLDPNKIKVGQKLKIPR